MLIAHLKKLLSLVPFAALCLHTMVNIKLIGKMMIVSNSLQLAIIHLFDNSASRQLLAQFISTDFTYYHPSGDIALFYSHFVYALGRIETGKETLAGIPQDFTTTLEKINNL